MASDQEGSEHAGSHATGINSNEGNQATGAGAVVQVPTQRPAIYETTAVLPGDVTVSLTKGRTLIEALSRVSVSVPMSNSTTLLIVTLKVDPKLLPTSHQDFGKEGLKPRLATVFVDYISTERIKAIINAKTRPAQGEQPRRLCYKCLAHDPVSTDPTRRTIDLTVWNRSNPLRHVMEWHPLRMIMHATIPVELTWHKSCLNEPGKTLNKVRENWMDSTPGSLFRILSTELGTTLTASPKTTKIKLFGVLPPPVANKGISFDYAGFVTKLWDAGEELGGEQVAAGKEAHAKSTDVGSDVEADDKDGEGEVEEVVANDGGKDSDGKKKEEDGDDGDDEKSSSNDDDNDGKVDECDDEHKMDLDEGRADGGMVRRVLLKKKKSNK